MYILSEDYQFESCFSFTTEEIEAWGKNGSWPRPSAGGVIWLSIPGMRLPSQDFPSRLKHQTSFSPLSYLSFFSGHLCVSHHRWLWLNQLFLWPLEDAWVSLACVWPLLPCSKPLHSSLGTPQRQSFLLWPQSPRIPRESTFLPGLFFPALTWEWSDSTKLGPPVPS